MKSGKKYYAVARGVKPGLYRSWGGEDGAEAHVRGYAGAVYKGFTTLEDALDFLHAHGVRTEEHPNHQPRVRFDDDRVHIFTDGGAIGNPGPGGYGVVIIHQKRRKELSQGYRLTTNNRMELMACIAGLECLKKKLPAVIHSDSRYVVENIGKGHAQRWRLNGWLTATKKPAENIDLWRRLLDLVDEHRPQFEWVKGHGGAPENERCDQLAKAAANGKGLLIDEGYERAGEPGLCE